MAAERLNAASGVAAPMGGSAATGLTQDNFGSFSENLAAEVSVRPDAQSAASPAYRKFEAFMLQSFVQSMFTSDTTATFGKGIAGEYWKSMMAEAWRTRWQMAAVSALPGYLKNRRRETGGQRRRQPWPWEM